jgi:hypothetical protein
MHDNEQRTSQMAMLIDEMHSNLVSLTISIEYQMTCNEMIVLERTILAS